MKKSNKFLALGLTTAMVVSMLSGCGSSSTTTTDTASSSSSSTSTAASQTDSTGSAETDYSGQTLTVGLTTSTMVTDYENNYFTKYLEEQLGFNLEFYMLPADSAETRTKVALMATSQEDLPDVLVVDGHLSNEMILQYGSSGFFLALNDYLADASVMPNYNAIPDEDKEVMEQAQTMADGNMYSLSAYEPETWNLTPFRMFINKAWLDTLGLEEPTTTDELKDVLIAFRDGDPNGNGLQDEIGVYGYSGGGYGQNVTAALMNSFVFWNANLQNGGLALDESDGSTVIAPYTTDAWREGLRYMNDLYNEGLLSASIFTDDDTQFKATLNQDTPVVGLVTAGSLSNWTNVATNANFAQMDLIEPLSGPEGVQYTPYYIYSPSQELMILASTDKLDMALKFADQFFDHDTSIIERFGEEGVDWTRDPEVLAENTNAYVEAGLYDALTLVVTSTFWNDNQSQTWRNHGPRYASAEMGNTTFDISAGNKYDPDDPTQLNAKNYELYNPKHPDAVLPTLHYTEDEASQVQDQLTNIPDFVKQSLAEFVVGTRDVETGWDSYLKELDSMGLQEWIAIAQTAYDRTK